jgi:hypothetical protein
MSVNAEELRDTADEELDDLEADAGDAGASSEGQEGEAVKAAREAANEADRALREAEKQDLFDRRVKVYRELKEGQRDGFLTTTFDSGTAREAFAEEVAGIERAERVSELLTLGEQELLAAYREAEEALQADLETALEGDDDRLRMLLSRREEHVVSLPEVEPVEGEGAPAPIDWAARWAEGPMAETVENIEVFAAEAITDVRKGRVQVDPQIREQLEEFIAEADRYPEGHSFRVRALEQASGLASWAKAEHEAALPFGLGGVQSTKEYQAPDGKWHRLEIDGRGMKRDTVVENPVFASEAGLIDDGPAASEPFDPSSVKSLEDAKGISPDQWARIDPEKREQLLRQASAEIEAQELQTRTGAM